eukprot:a518597_34.p2 GENE.a518597_34~~a518597_34.p2  ORF type:complete len:312 (+),score=83.90 a518597_34:32-937(+)
MAAPEYPGVPPLAERVARCEAVIARAPEVFASLGPLSEDQGLDLSGMKVQSKFVQRASVAEFPDMAVDLRRPTRGDGYVLAFYPWSPASSAPLGTIFDAHKSGRLSPFFRFVVQCLANKFGVVDWHCQICPSDNEASFVIFACFGDATRAGPTNIGKLCHSCDTTTTLAQKSFLEEADGNRCWIDAKARPMTVVTPIVHVGAIADLDDASFAGFVDMTMRLLELRDGSPLKFASLKINHGTYRNWEHLHLKISYKKKAWEKFCKKFMTFEQRQRLEAIKARNRDKQQRKDRGEPVSSTDED